jgi:hypothetical protein
MLLHGCNSNLNCYISFSIDNAPLTITDDAIHTQQYSQMCLKVIYRNLLLFSAVIYKLFGALLTIKLSHKIANRRKNTLRALEKDGLMVLSFLLGKFTVSYFSQGITIVCTALFALSSCPRANILDT